MFVLIFFSRSLLNTSCFALIYSNCLQIIAPIKQLESLATYSCPVYLTGVFNIHVNDSSDKFTIELEGLFETFRLLQSEEQYTRARPYAGLAGL